MFWQDWVFTIGNWVFILALLPSVWSKSKPALLTSLSTCVVLLTFALAFATMGLFLTALSTVVSSLVWGILFFQQMRRSHELL